MDKEKMIEEMAKDVKKILTTKCVLNAGGHCEDCKYDNLGDKASDCLSVLVVDELTNQGYRKIPDGAVVLTKEQQDEIDKGIHDTYLAGRLDGSKETAREILDEVSKHYGGKWLVGLYKKFGLEVE